MKPLNQRDLYDRFDDFLDSIQDDIHVTGYSYSPSNVLRSVDPVAYQCTFNDWLDNETSDNQIFELDGEYFTED